MASEVFELSNEVLCGRSRVRSITILRQVTMYVIRRETSLSYPAIARLFSDRDHTTVLYAVQKVERLKDERPVKQHLQRLTDGLGEIYG